MSKKLFALVDCNNFYASCEKLFRPDLKNKPVIILSNNDGCVIARSKEAKQLGIKMGLPFYQIAPLIKTHQITVFSSNYALYADMSHRVMETLAAEVPRIEVYSIDEAFLELSGMEQLMSYQAYGELIQEKVAKEIGLSVGVGISTTKTLAKLANYAAKTYPKTGGVVDLTSSTRQKKLLQITPVSEVWGVGRQLSKHLNSLQIKSAWDLACANTAFIRKAFSVVLERTVRELNGESCLDLEEMAQPKQQIVCSRSFGQKITELESMQQAIATYAARAAEKLRGENQLTKFIQVFFSTNRFNDTTRYYANSASVRLLQATNDTRVIMSMAKEAITQIWQSGFLYAKAGVVLADFYPVHYQQYDLFLNVHNNDKLMRVVDKINQKNRHTLFFAGEGVHPDWQMKRRYLSPAYTTNWRDLMIVR